MDRRPIATVVALLIALGGCSNVASDSIEKPEQTWKRSYSMTTCDDFKTKMASTERWAAAAELLIASRNRWARRESDDVPSLPSKEEVQRFGAALLDACTVSSSLEAISVSVYDKNPKAFDD